MAPIMYGNMLGGAYLGGPVGGWKKLASTTVGNTPVDRITIDDLPHADFLKVLIGYVGLAGGTIRPELRFDETDGILRTQTHREINGSSVESLNSSNADMPIGHSAGIVCRYAFSEITIRNIVGTHKMCTIKGIYGTSSDVVATYHVLGGGVVEHATGPSDISSLEFKANSGSNDAVIRSGSNMTVLGMSAGDRHTDNFWKPLASVRAPNNDATAISTPVFDSVRYLKVHAYYNSGRDTLLRLRSSGNVNSAVTFRYGEDGTSYTSTGIQGGIRPYAVGHQDRFVPVVATMFNPPSDRGMGLVAATAHWPSTNGKESETMRYGGFGKHSSSPVRRMEIGSTTFVSYTTDAFLKVWGGE